MSILAYHMVEPRFSWGLTRVTPRQFERQIAFLLDHDFAILRISDYLALESCRRAVAITFDDGYESVYRHAFPVLRQVGAVASVFVNPGYVGQFSAWDITLGRRFRCMDWEQLVELRAAGWEIGAHGMGHCDLTRLSDERLAWELRLAAELIERRLGDCSAVLAYPFGNMSPRAAEQAAAQGYHYGLGMGMLGRDRRLHYSIGRSGVYLVDALPFFRCKVYGRYNSFFNLMHRILHLCAGVTVVFRLKSWQSN